jgi:hypothetical protein
MTYSTDVVYETYTNKHCTQRRDEVMSLLAGRYLPQRLLEHRRRLTT